MSKVLMTVYLSCSRGSSHNPTSNNVHNHDLKPQQHQHQQQLLLMRVSSVKSAPKDQNSNNNTKKDNATELRTNNEDIHQVHGQQGNLAWPDYLGQTALQTLCWFSSSGMTPTAASDYGPHHHGSALHHHLQQQPDLADQLLQQCLVPVVPNPRELTGGLWFRCRLCSRVELTSKLSAHARQYHHTDHVTDCISR